MYDLQKQKTDSFPHAVYGLGSGMAIMTMFYLAGGVSILIMGEDFFYNHISIVAASQSFLFILIPALLVTMISPMGIRELLRLENLPSIPQVLALIVGVLFLQIFSGSYLVVQEALVPDSLLKYYDKVNDYFLEVYSKLTIGDGFWGLTFAVLGAALAPALSEEILFRGVVQKSFEKQIPAVWAVLITSIMFSIVHFHPINIVPLFIIGIFLGFSAYYSNSLILPVLAHFLNNAAAVVFMNFAVFEDLESQAYSESIEMSITALFVSIICVALCVAAMYLTKPKSLRQSVE